MAVGYIRYFEYQKRNERSTVIAEIFVQIETSSIPKEFL